MRDRNLNLDPLQNIAIKTDDQRTSILPVIISRTKLIKIQGDQTKCRQFFKVGYLTLIEFLFIFLCLNKFSYSCLIFLYILQIYKKYFTIERISSAVLSCLKLEKRLVRLRFLSFVLVYLGSIKS